MYPLWWNQKCYRFHNVFKMFSLSCTYVSPLNFLSQICWKFSLDCTVYPIYFSGFIDYNWEEWECISCVQKAADSAEQLANPVVTEGIESDRALMISKDGLPMVGSSFLFLVYHLCLRVSRIHFRMFINFVLEAWN